jgi:hypothetical protein
MEKETSEYYYYLVPAGITSQVKFSLLYNVTNHDLLKLHFGKRVCSFYQQGAYHVV